MENKSAFTDAEREAETRRRRKQNRIDSRERWRLNKDELPKNKLLPFLLILSLISFIFIGLLLFSFVFTTPDLENSSEAVVTETSTRRVRQGPYQRLTLEKPDGSLYRITTQYYHGIQPGDTISIVRHRRVTRYVGDYTHWRWTFERILFSVILALGAVVVLFLMIPVSVAQIVRKFKNK